MPLYEYECDACGRRFEVIQKFSETTTECRHCGKGPVRRLVAAPAFQFKGTGWYITDYAKKDSGGKTGQAPAGEKSDTASSASSSDTKADSAKSDAGSSAKSGAGTSGSTPAAKTGSDAKAGN